MQGRSFLAATQNYVALPLTRLTETPTKEQI
jgi:hypothetical protein